MSDFTVVGEVDIDGGGDSAIQNISGALDGLTGTAGGAATAFAGVGTAILTAFGSAAMSALQNVASGITGLIGDSLGAADKHDKAIAQLSAALASNATAQNNSTTAGGQWVTTTDLGTKAAGKLQTQIDHLQTSIANQNEKDALMGKTSKATQVSLFMKGQQLDKLNQQLKDGTAAHTEWVSNIQQSIPVVQMSLTGIEQLSESMSTHTLFSSDQYLAASQYLVQMGTIGKDVFPTALQATADLATRMNVDLTSASQTVAKALADPATGIGRLSTMFKGQFDPALLTSIKYMAAHGQMAKAQTTILDALTRAVGGSADAAAQAGLGPWQLLQNRWADVQDQIGNALIPGLDSIATAVGPVIDQVLPKLTDFLQNKVGPAVSTVTGVVANFIGGLTSGVDPLDAFENALVKMGISGDTYTSLVNFAGEVGTFIAGIPAAVQQIQSFVTNVANIAAPIIAAGVAISGQIISGISQLTQVVSTFVTSVEGGASPLDAFKTALTQLNLPPATVQSISDFATEIVTQVIPAVSNFISKIGPAVTSITGFVSSLQGASNNVSGFATTTGTQLALTYTQITGFATNLSNGVDDFVSSGKAIVNGIIDGIGSTIANVGTELAKGPAGWLSDLQAAVTGFEGVGKNVIDGIIKGIQDNVDALLTAMENAMSGLVGKALSALGINSPSKVFAAMGSNITQGMALGIQRGTPGPVAAVQAMSGQMIGATTNHNYQNRTNITYNFGSSVYRPQGANPLSALRSS